MWFDPCVAGLDLRVAPSTLARELRSAGILPDVADGAIVEVGATVDGHRIHPDEMPPLGEPLAGWVNA